MISIEDLYGIYKKNYLVDTDTRKIRKGSVFFALKGGNFNGNLFAIEALNKGADYAIVDEVLNDGFNPKILLVNDVLKTLQKLANHHRKELAIPILALTGSNGKTTTKELINVVLSEKFKTFATQGNFNNHIGVPLTLLSMDNTVEFGVVEMGANHIGEIAELTRIVEPDYGYITNFGKAHLEGFGSIEGVVKGKSELYDFLRRKDKIAFVNQSDEKQLQLTRDFNRVFFNDSISFLESNPFVTLNFDDSKLKSNLIGTYNYNNIALACTVGGYFNIRTEKIIKAIEGYIPENNRSQIIKTKENEVLLDAYNANPSSMDVAISNFKGLNATFKVIILGDMFELGDVSLEEHQKITDNLKSKGFDDVFLIGENFYKTNNQYKKHESFDNFIKEFKNNKIKGSYFLIKGSRGMALERIVNYIL